MGARIRRYLLFFFIAAISVNFILYSSQRYSPPRAESQSYSVMDCPSHDGSGGMTKIAQFFLGSEKEEGSEKHCFCYSCCEDRVSPVLSAPDTLTTLLTYKRYTTEFYEFGLSDDSYKHLPIRSPPESLS